VRGVGEQTVVSAGPARRSALRRLTSGLYSTESSLKHFLQERDGRRTPPKTFGRATALQLAAIGLLEGLLLARPLPERCPRCSPLLQNRRLGPIGSQCLFALAPAYAALMLDHAVHERLPVYLDAQQVKPRW
jgi:hypothetical protein